MSASEKFDPYRKWLGIPTAEQPPNHYRLLGVGLFEDDADTLSTAADRQMAHIRTFQAGPHSALSQSLLNELAAARLTLLDAKKKASYDEQLRAKLGRPAATTDGAGQDRGAPAPVPIPLPLAVMKATPPAVRQAGPAPVPMPAAAAPAGQGRAGEPDANHLPAIEGAIVTASRRGRARRPRPEPALWAGLVAAAAALAAVVYVAREQFSDDDAPINMAVQEKAPLAKPARPRLDADLTGVRQSGAEPMEDPPPESAPGEARSSAADEMPHEASANEASPDGTPGNSQPPSDHPPDEPKPAPEKRPQLSELLSRAARPQIEAPRREPSPEGKALAIANARVSQLHGKEILKARKAPEAARRLAFRFFNLAREGTDTSDVRFVLLNLTGVAAAKQGNVGLAYRVAAEVARQFDVEPYSLKFTALDATGKNASEPSANAVGVLQALALAERAAADGKHDLVSKAADLAVLLARKTKDKDLMAQTDQAKAAMREQSGRNAIYQKALNELKKLPESPEANLAAGKYEVLVLGDWPAGLLKLAACGDPRWLAIAEGEALASADLSQWAPLASAWWQMADSEPDDFFQLQCRMQARYGYLRARQTGRAGELPVGIAEQLRAFKGYPMSRLRPGLAARYYEGERFGRQRVERIDPAIDFNFGEGSPDPTVPNSFFSARWTGFFKPPLGGRYLIVTHTDDSVRLWIDGEQVLDRWRQAARWQQVELELTPQLHTIQMDFNDTVANAVAMLGWTLAAFPDPDHIQWSPIDALYYDPDSPFDLPELK